MIGFLAMLLQTASDPSAIPWPAIGVGGGPTAVTGLVLYFYRTRETQFAAQVKAIEERHAAEREAAEERIADERKASEDRYAALAMDWRQIVTENSSTNNHLADTIGRLMAAIPFPLDRPLRSATHGD